MAIRTGDLTRNTLRLLLGVMLLGCLVGCGDLADKTILTPPNTADLSVVVQRGDLTPTVLVNAQVIASPTIFLLSPTEGRLQLIAEPGGSVSQGAEVAHVGDTSMVAPVSGVVQRTHVRSGQDVPAGLPLLDLQHPGFALVGSLPAGASFPMGHQLRARGQVSDGAAPFECASVSPALSDEEGHARRATYACLVPRDVSVDLGGNGVFVITTSTLKDVLLVPASTVAGRRDSGWITVIDGDQRDERTVSLGASDGRMIEVVSGLTEGETVSLIAPNLATPRS